MVRRPVDGGIGARAGRRLGPTAPVLCLVRARVATSTCHAKAITGSERRTRSARRLTLHLPTAWPWQKAWEQLAAAAHSPPLTV